MTICRLSDPVRSANKDNLSFSLLPRMFPQVGNLSERVEIFRGACSRVQQLRSKLIAHNDLSTRLKPMENPLPGVKRTDIDQILFLAADVLNVID